MKILVVNAGSSSLKYQLIDMQNEQVICKGICERIGTSGVIKHKTANGKAHNAEIPMPTHREAFDCVVQALTTGDAKVIDSLEEITAVGHRVVQGGSAFKQATRIDARVMEAIERCSELAPLHNPANILGIEACTKVLGDRIPQVAVFDTSFHQTMPPVAYMYALPYEYYEKYGIRRYGFHGTSHQYVSDRAAALVGRDKKDLKIITCHLGNGCSIAAVQNGACIDTSMGFTPLDGFIMGTRSGSVDPSALTYIAQKEDLSAQQIADICNKKSGLLGISGISNDSRDVTEAGQAGNERAQLAVDMQQYQVAKCIGSYIVAMGGVDIVAFAGGIGENNPQIREYVCDKMGFLGVRCDKKANQSRGEEVRISTPDSKVAVYVIPTNEELVIARQTKALL